MNPNYLKDKSERVLRKLRLYPEAEKSKRGYSYEEGIINLNERALLSESAGVSVYSKSKIENRGISFDTVAESVPIYKKDSNSNPTNIVIGTKYYGLFDFSILYVLESDYDTYIIEDFDQEDKNNIPRAECHLLIHMKHTEGRSRKERQQDWNKFRNIILNNSNILLFNDIK